MIMNEKDIEKRIVLEEELQHAEALNDIMDGVEESVKDEKVELPKDYVEATEDDLL